MAHVARGGHGLPRQLPLGSGVVLAVGSGPTQSQHDRAQRPGLFWGVLIPKLPGRSSGSWSFQTQAPKGRLDSNVAPDHGGPRGGRAGQQTRAQGPAHPRAQCRGVLVLLDREQRECGVMADFKHQRQGGLNSQCSLLSWEAGHLIYGRSGVWLGPGAWSLEGCLLTVSSYGPRDKRALWALTQGHRSHSRRLHPPDSGTSQWPPRQASGSALGDTSPQSVVEVVQEMFWGQISSQGPNPP